MDSEIKTFEETKRPQDLIFTHFSMSRAMIEELSIFTVSSRPYASSIPVKTKNLMLDSAHPSSSSDNRTLHRSQPNPTKLKIAWSNENRTLTRLLPAIKLSADVRDSASAANARPATYQVSRNLTTGERFASLATENLDYALPFLPANISLADKNSNTSPKSSHPIVTSLLSNLESPAHMRAKHLTTSDKTPSAETDSNNLRNLPTNIAKSRPSINSDAYVQLETHIHDSNADFSECMRSSSLPRSSPPPRTSSPLQVSSNPTTPSATPLQSPRQDADGKSSPALGYHLERWLQPHSIHSDHAYSSMEEEKQPCAETGSSGTQARLWPQYGHRQNLASAQTLPPFVAIGGSQAPVDVQDVQKNHESSTAFTFAAPDLGSSSGTMDRVAPLDVKRPNKRRRGTEDGRTTKILGHYQSLVTTTVCSYCRAETTRYSDRRPQCSKCGRYEGQTACPSVPVEQRQHMSRKSNNNKHLSAYSAPQSHPRNSKPFPHGQSSLHARPPRHHPKAKDLSWLTTPGILISATADKALIDEYMKTGITDSTLLCLTNPTFMDWTTDSRRMADLMASIDVGTLDPDDPLDRFLIRTDPTSSNSN